MRNIFTVNATQIVVSQSNPQGVLSNIDGYPKAFDSRSYKATAENPNGDESIALVAAQKEYYTKMLDLLVADTQSRVAWSVSVTRASDDKQLFVRSWGAFPDMTPIPPEPEPFVEGE
jgi:hypothetical protein